MAVRLVAVVSTLAMVLINIYGPKSSVGGPLTDLFMSFLVMWVVGLYFAWSKRFGVLGWFLSMVVAIIGGITGIVLLGTVMDWVLEFSHFQGRLVDTHWIYPASVAMALVAVLASWAPLEIGSRLLMRPSEHDT